MVNIISFPFIYCLAFLIVKFNCDVNAIGPAITDAVFSGSTIEDLQDLSHNKDKTDESSFAEHHKSKRCWRADPTQKMRLSFDPIDNENNIDRANTESVEGIVYNKKKNFATRPKKERPIISNAPMNVKILNDLYKNQKRSVEDSEEIWNADKSLEDSAVEENSYLRLVPIKNARKNLKDVFGTNQETQYEIFNNEYDENNEDVILKRIKNHLNSNDYNVLALVGRRNDHSHADKPKKYSCCCKVPNCSGSNYQRMIYRPCSISKNSKPVYDSRVNGYHSVDSKNGYKNQESRFTNLQMPLNIQYPVTMNRHSEYSVNNKNVYSKDNLQPQVVSSSRSSSSSLSGNGEINFKSLQYNQPVIQDKKYQVIHETKAPIEDVYLLAPTHTNDNNNQRAGNSYHPFIENAGSTRPFIAPRIVGIARHPEFSNLQIGQTLDETQPKIINNFQSITNHAYNKNKFVEKPEYKHGRGQSFGWHLPNEMRAQTYPQQAYYRAPFRISTLSLPPAVNHQKVSVSPSISNEDLLSSQGSEESSTNKNYHSEDNEETKNLGIASSSNEENTRYNVDLQDDYSQDTLNEEDTNNENKHLQINDGGASIEANSDEASPLIFHKNQKDTNHVEDSSILSGSQEEESIEAQKNGTITISSNELEDTVSGFENFGAKIDHPQSTETIEVKTDGKFNNNYQDFTTPETYSSNTEHAAPEFVISNSQKINTEDTTHHDYAEYFNDKIVSKDHVEQSTNSELSLDFDRYEDETTTQNRYDPRVSSEHNYETHVDRTVINNYNPMYDGSKNYLSPTSRAEENYKGSSYFPIWERMQSKNERGSVISQPKCTGMKQSDQISITNHDNTRSSILTGDDYSDIREVTNGYFTSKDYDDYGDMNRKDIQVTLSRPANPEVIVKYSSDTDSRNHIAQYDAIDRKLSNEESSSTSSENQSSTESILQNENSEIKDNNMVGGNTQPVRDDIDRPLINQGHEFFENPKILSTESYTRTIANGPETHGGLDAKNQILELPIDDTEVIEEGFENTDERTEIIPGSSEATSPKIVGEKPSDAKNNYEDYSSEENAPILNEETSKEDSEFKSKVNMPLFHKTEINREYVKMPYRIDHSIENYPVLATHKSSEATEIQTNEADLQEHERLDSSTQLMFNEPEFAVENYPIKYFSPDDRVLEYIKKHSQNLVCDFHPSHDDDQQSQKQFVTLAEQDEQFHTPAIYHTNIDGEILGSSDLKSKQSDFESYSDEVFTQSSTEKNYSNEYKVENSDESNGKRILDIDPNLKFSGGDYFNTKTLVIDEKPSFRSEPYEEKYDKSTGYFQPHSQIVSRVFEKPEDELFSERSAEYLETEKVDIQRVPLTEESHENINKDSKEYAYHDYAVFATTNDTPESETTHKEHNNYAQRHDSIEKNKSNEKISSTLKEQEKSVNPILSKNYNSVKIIGSDKTSLNTEGLAGIVRNEQNNKEKSASLEISPKILHLTNLHETELNNLKSENLSSECGDFEQNKEYNRKVDELKKELTTTNTPMDSSTYDSNPIEYSELKSLVGNSQDRIVESNSQEPPITHLRKEFSSYDHDCVDSTSASYTTEESDEVRNTKNWSNNEYKSGSVVGLSSSYNNRLAADYKLKTEVDENNENFLVGKNVNIVSNKDIKNDMQPKDIVLPGFRKNVENLNDNMKANGVQKIPSLHLYSSSTYDETNDVENPLPELNSRINHDSKLKLRNNNAIDEYETQIAPPVKVMVLDEGVSQDTTESEVERYSNSAPNNWGDGYMQEEEKSTSITAQKSSVKKIANDVEEKTRYSIIERTPNIEKSDSSSHSESLKQVELRTKPEIVGAAQDLGSCKKPLEVEDDPGYLGRLAPKKSVEDVKSIGDLLDSDLYYIGDGVRLPLTIKKLKDGSFALSISDKICEQRIKERCPCCVPREGRILQEPRSEHDDVTSLEKINSGNLHSEADLYDSQKLNLEEYELGKTESKLKIEHHKKRATRSVTMPVDKFILKYNLNLNLDDLHSSDTHETLPADKSHLKHNVIQRDEATDDNQKRNDNLVQKLTSINKTPENEKVETLLETLQDLIETEPTEVHAIINEIDEKLNKMNSQKEFPEDNLDRDIFEIQDAKYGYQRENPILDKIKIIKQIWNKKNRCEHKYQKDCDAAITQKTELLKTILYWLKELAASKQI